MTVLEKVFPSRLRLPNISPCTYSVSAIHTVEEAVTYRAVLGAVSPNEFSLFQGSEKE